MIQPPLGADRSRRRRRDLGVGARNLGAIGHLPDAKHLRAIGSRDRIFTRKWGPWTDNGPALPRA
jgi:hypothetical protein